MKKARAQLEDETNLVEIIKLHRFMRCAVQQILPTSKLEEIDKLTRFQVVDPDSSFEVIFEQDSDRYMEDS